MQEVQWGASATDYSLRCPWAWVMALFHCVVRLGSARLITARLIAGRFVFPLQFSAALERAGLFTRRYSCAASTAVTSSWTRHKQTHNKERRRNSVLHSWRVDVFNSNGEVYENDCNLPPPPSRRDCGGSATGCRDVWCRCDALLE